MSQEYIEIRAARENNLKNVSLKIPKRKLTIFTGVSGSGKSSIVFDTIATESQRLLNENFSMFVRNFLPRFSQPDVDAIENLSMAVVVDQKRLGGGSHSTVGTITDSAPVLRLLYSRIGQPYIGNANMFSFNDQQGMCPDCNGMGRKIGITSEALIDKTKSLNEGAVIAPGLANLESDIYGRSGYFDNDKKIADYTTEELELLLYSEPRKHTGLPYNTYEGLVYKFNRKFVTRDIQTLSPRIRQKVEPFLKLGPCPLCKGARLNQAALSCKVKGYNIADMAAMEVDELLEVIKGITEPAVAPIVRTLSERLENLIDIGLEYLSLNRETGTLSGGESQRVKIVKHLSSSLTDVIYIFDEPSVGLHPRDVHRLNELLVKLRDKGNTVIVVEHEPEVIKIADYIVDVGPYAGSEGGTIVYEGSYAGLLEANTLTGRYIRQSLPLKEAFRTATGKLPIRHAKLNNLQDVSLDVPTDVLTVVTGVAGSGKSSLINQVFFQQHPTAIMIDQSAVGGSTRSNPATYTGIMDGIRKAFASTNWVSSSLFSFNSKGACENCQGLGVIYTDLGFLNDAKSPCESCGGKRFKDEVLTYKLNGKSITEVLELTVKQAVTILEIKEIAPTLQAMSDVGLDYLTLGQPLNTLSGGECQRIKLASELHKKGSIYVMDEPTTGLHMSDIRHLLAIMNRLVDSGNTVIVIEHNLDVVKNADWLIDMGPEGGNKGGKVIFEGTPKQLLHATQSLTSAYLKLSL